MKDSVYYRDYTKKKIKGIFKDYKQSVMLALLKLKRGPNTVVPTTDMNAVGSDIDENRDEDEDSTNKEQTQNQNKTESNCYKESEHVSGILKNHVKANNTGEATTASSTLIIDVCGRDSSFSTTS